MDEEEVKKNLKSIIDGQKYSITVVASKYNKKYVAGKEKYFIIYDYDIRFYDHKNYCLLEFNTYPNNPRDILVNIFSMS